MRIHTLPGVLHFDNPALQRNALPVGEHNAVELQIEARRFVDNPQAHFPDRHHGTFDSGSERKQHFAALGQWSDQNARDFGSLLGSVGADRLLKTNLQPGSDRDRLGQGVESCKCQRREAALEKGFIAPGTH